MQLILSVVFEAARAALIVAAILCASAPRVASAAAFCSAAELAQIVNRPDAAWSACVVGPAAALLETGYYQNASSVGGADIAEYPNAELRFGLDPKLELLVDSPTQVDVSGNHGKGFFSLSDPGLGLKYQLADRGNGAIGLGAELHPPSTAASFHVQPDYRLEVDSTELVGSKLQATVGLGVVDESRIARSVTSTPALRSSAGLGLSTSPSTTVSIELLDQASVARSLRGQSFGDLAVRQGLTRHVLLDIEGGQTFNTSAHARPHYIGAGLAFGPTR
jgi:hypothetical protein